MPDDSFLGLPVWRTGSVGVGVGVVIGVVDRGGVRRHGWERRILGVVGPETGLRASLTDIS